MYRIGLTGGIASGKSTVVKLLQEMGLPVINLDLISREVTLKGTPGYREILAVFGQTILTPSGDIDRKELGKIVFNDSEKRKLLESITHPLILQMMEERISYLAESGAEAVVVEVPLLIEVGMANLFDQVWLVYVTREIQVRRLKGRDNLTDLEVESRLRAQLPLDGKRQFADKIIVNTGDIDELQEQLNKIWRELHEEISFNRT